MNHKLFLTLITLSTIISWISWGIILFYFNPQQIGFLGFSLFYLSLFLSLSGLIFLIALVVKAKIFKKQMFLNRFQGSIRHAVLFAILILGWMFLSSQELLRWWNLLLFILILAALEFFFMTQKKRVNEPI